MEVTNRNAPWLVMGLFTLAIIAVFVWKPIWESHQNVVFVVSTQSKAIDPVDITVYLDESVIVSGTYRVGSQHNFHRYKRYLEPGNHTIRAVSRTGNATASRSVVVEDGQPLWISVFFWYYPPEHYSGGSGPNIAINTQKTPMQFL